MQIAPSSSSLKTSSPARPLLAVGLIVGSVFMALSLFSYSATDPSWTFASSDGQLRNLGGFVGAWLSDLFLQMLGANVYLVTLIAFWYGVRRLTPQAVLLSGTPKSKSHWKFAFALLLGILSLSGLLSLLPFKIYQSISLGGAVGYLASRAGVVCFSPVGATLFFFGGLWASAVMLNERLHENLFGQPIRVAQNIQQKLARMGTYLKLIPVRFLEIFKKREPEVHGMPKKIFSFKTKTLVEETEIKKPEAKPINIFKSESVANHLPEEEKIEKPASESLPLFAQVAERIFSPAKTDRVLLVQEAPTRKKERKTNERYEFPSLQLIDPPLEKGTEISKDELIANSRALEQKLLDFGVQGQVTNIRPGPIITLYEFEPAPGVKVKNIVNLGDDLKLAMKAVSIRIIAPIPGKAAVGIEIPNPRRQTVALREILQSPLFQNSSAPLLLGMGKTTAGDPYVTDLAKMPHLLIAGATGSGKSVGLNAMIVSLLFKASPEELKFIMIDPKMLELSVYEGIPHLLLPVVTDPKKASRALAWAVKEMERRYKLISSLGARNLKSYNEKVERLSEDELKKELEMAAKNEAVSSAIIEDPEETAKETQQSLILKEAGLDHYVKLPNIVIVIDELADLIMVAAREVEESIARLAQMARAAGIHLIIATQRPSVDVITGVIKANLPTRCAFQVASKVDSRTIIDTNGAENLIGDGDMLFLPPGTSRLERLHGPFISEDEIARVVRHLKAQANPNYASNINLEENEASAQALDEDFDDELYDQALQVVFETKSPSASMIQRRLRVGYNRAARMIERMEQEGIVSAPLAGGKGREILVTPSYDTE